jgi:subtilisin family serine protease
MPMIPVLITMMSLATSPDVISSDHGLPDLLIKTSSLMEIGVDTDDRWILIDSNGVGARLPEGSIQFAAPSRPFEGARSPSETRLGLHRWIRLTLTEDADLIPTLEALRQLPGVVIAESDVIGSFAGTGDPDDPNFDLQWNMSNTGQVVQGVTGVVGADIRAVGAWEISTGEAPIIVATLDSGTYEHSEFASRILPGWNATNGSSDTSDVCGGHGTRVAGIIAATGNNGSGVAGLNWTAQVLPVIVSGPCSVSQIDTADGLVWAVNQGARVINMSLQFSSPTEYLHDAILYAVDNDVLVVAASGNSGSSVTYPGKWAETIAVGAMDNTDARWSSSSFGPELDLVAPGASVTSTWLGGGYNSSSGTSFAAPHVSGLASLLLSIEPDLTAGELREIITGSARDISLVGFDNFTGWGCLDAQAALEQLDPSVPSADINGDGQVTGADLTILVSFWGSCVSCDADLDGNGFVNGADLVLLLAQWSSL